MKHESRRPDPWTLLSCILILALPAIILLKHHHYDYFAPESLMLLGSLGALGLVAAIVMSVGGRVVSAAVMAGLMLWFLDNQFDWPDGLGGSAARVVLAAGGALSAAVGVIWFILRDRAGRVGAAVLGTMVLSTLLIPAGSSFPHLARAGSAPPSPPSDLPVVLHLVLDQHIGLEGIPRDVPGGPAIRAALKGFYLDNGFSIFGGAYSESPQTALSLGGMLNFDPEFPARFAERLSDGGQLPGNAYLAEMGERGHRVHVYQSSFADLCNARNVTPVQCYTFHQNSIASLDEAPLSVVERLRVISSVYLRQSHLYQAVQGAYTALRPALVSRGWEVPRWAWERDRVGPLAVLPVLAQLRRDLSRASAGDMFFAHLLLPHAPYILDDSCRVRPVAEWRERVDRPHENTADDRKSIYQDYFQQVECTTVHISELLDALDASGRASDAVVMIHGDHGSKIAVTEASESNSSRLAEADYVDAFSTLFAVRAAGIEPGYRDQPISIREILQDLVRGGPDLTPEAIGADAPPTVFLRGGTARRPLIGFHTRESRGAAAAK